MMNDKTDMPKAYAPEDVEDKWYAQWMAKELFKGVPNHDKKPYSIVIPPPNVTGILTMGHVLNNTLQDILIRWRRMRGHETCWFPGTDHAGIATESKVEAFLRQEEGTGRDELGREAFVERVWEWKEKYGGTIMRQLRKLGASCDWDRTRFTMDDGLSQAVRLVFVKLYEKGYIYRGRRMINWCPVSRTALSDEEVVYKEVNGKFYHYKYPLSDGSGELVIATTRPETMLGDTAVAVHPDDERYKHLVGKTVDLPLTNRKIPVIADVHADPEKGTGCVKITPGHDPNDFEVGQRHDLEILNVMNRDASMNAAAGERFEGLDRFECRKKVVEELEQGGLMVEIEDIVHSVGYSERGDVPIETVVSEQWFVKMKDLAAPAIEAVRNGDIKFHPERWSKTYFHWMENIKDWCVSRQIWWGHRIPAWYNDETGAIHVGMDAPTDDGPWRQDEDVLDTWFSSWLWPFSIMGWPEETPEQDYFYPTNDLVTGPDIIFFWVARMIMAGLEFKGTIPFDNVYFTSIIRDDKGRKLSKSLGNSPDPLEVIKTYGADALRFSIIYIAPIGIDIRYSNDKCELGRNFANKLWNASRFRTMQGPVSADPGAAAKIDADAITDIDRWILGRLSAVSAAVNQSLENFRFNEVAKTLYDFVWSEFCDWYIEASKQTLTDPEIKENALRVFDHVWFAILRLLHPFMPFVTEEIAHQLGYLDAEETIMRAEFPEKVPAGQLDRLGVTDALVAKTEAKFAVITAGRNLRVSYKIDPGKRLPYFFKPASEDMAAFLQEQNEAILKLMRAESFVIDADYAPDGPAPSIVTDVGTIYLPLKGIVDVDAEIEKLDKQKKELQGWIAKSKGKLGNKNFLEKAPEKVVADAKNHLAELEEKLAAVEETLNDYK